MSERREWGVLDVDAIMRAESIKPAADVRWDGDYPPMYVADTRRWAVEALFDRFGQANLKDAEALVQYVLHGRTEA